MGHGHTLPIAILFAAPDQRRDDHVMAVTIDVSPHFDALADDTLDGKAAAIDQRIDIFDMECAAGSGTRDGLSCSIHGDAIDMENAPRFVCGKETLRTYNTKPLIRYWFPGNGGGEVALIIAILFLHLENFATQG